MNNEETIMVNCRWRLTCKYPSPTKHLILVDEELKLTFNALANKIKEALVNKITQSINEKFYQLKEESIQIELN